MKKYATLIIGALLIWNSILTFEYIGVKNLLDSLELTGEVKIIREVDTEFNSNISDVIKGVETGTPILKMVVGVSNYYQTNLVSTGSGAIYLTQEGNVFIITNTHVVEGATRVTVTFESGEEVDAIVMGSDKYTDLALLKVVVDYTPPYFELGDSSLLNIGDIVLAIGSPLGFDFSGSVTMGIISGKDRIIPVDIDGDGNDDWDSVVIQTDAAINPGNSGGPLINLAGELIGITSMKIADSSVEGMGFAIPINEIIPIIDQLMTNGKVIRPLLGISAVSIDTMISSQKSFYGVDFKLQNGIMITSLQAGSPAAKAGLKAKDVITTFDGTAITSFKQFRQLLYGKKVGDEVQIGYQRGTTVFTTSAKLE